MRRVATGMEGVRKGVHNGRERVLFSAQHFPEKWLVKTQHSEFLVQGRS